MPTPSQSKILYIDDEKINLFLFEMAFKKYGPILTAPSAAEGLKLLETHPSIKVIISDVNMPEMDGLTFVRLAHAHYPEKEYHLLTGYEKTDAIREAMREGIVCKYFRKPFRKDEILAVFPQEAV